MNAYVCAMTGRRTTCVITDNVSLPTVKLNASGRLLQLSMLAEMYVTTGNDVSTVDLETSA